MGSKADASPTPGGWLADRYAALCESGEPPPDVFSFLGAHPDADTRERLGVLLVDQRHRWRNGEGLPVEAYLSAAPEIAGHPEVVVELRRGELRLRGERDEAAAPVDAPGLLPSGDPDVGSPSMTESGSIEPPTFVSGARTEGVGLSMESSAFDTKDVHGQSTNADFSLDVDLEIEAPGGGDDWLSGTARFTIQNRLGAGGMGVVYRAFDRERGEIVALKTMRRLDARSLYRFKQEFRTLADLSHPNLVNLYEMVAIGDHWFFAMELVEGDDFIAHIRCSGDDLATAGVAPTPEQVVRLRRALRQLAGGVAALHEAGKLHRDIKPTNVLVTGRGRVVLLDFGLSADLGPSGRHESHEEPIVGTVAYMAPEQGAGKPVSAASDWYSVGVILFVALTGRLPFVGTASSVLVRKREAESPRASAIAVGVPADLDALCAALLRRDPAARPGGRAVLARLAEDGERAEADDDEAGESADDTTETAVVVEAGSPQARGSSTIAGRASEEKEPPDGRGSRAGPASPLVGRERHRDVLRAAFESVRCGRTEVLFVSGRSGSGKSTLLQAFLDELSARGEAVVLAGRCYERESVPYKALDSVVDVLSRYLKPLPQAEVRALLPRDISLLARVFPVLQRVEAVATAPRPTFEIPDQQELRRRAFAALRTLLARIGREKPLIVSIDDLQWADPENASLIADLVRPPDPPLLLLLGSFRTEDVETSPFLRALLGSESEDSTTRLTLRFQQLSIGALSQGESRALALALLGRDDPITRAEAHLIARESQGNPFFLDELVKHVQAGGGLGHPPPSAGSITLDEVLRARVGRLPDDARRLLGVVAVSGRPIGQLLAFQALGLGGEGRGRAAVGLLRTARLIRSSGPSRRDAIEVYHDRIRESVIAHLPADVLREHHLRLAETLEATGQADPEALAVQFQGASRFDKAGHYFARAADRAAESLAFNHSARLYRRALDLRGPDGSDTSALRVKLGDALANAGRGGEAACAYLDATAGADVAGVLELKRRATMQLLISGRVDEGLAALKAVLGALGMTLPCSPRRSLAWLILRRARLWLRGYGFLRRDTSQLSAELLTRIDLCWSAATGLSIIDPICGAEFQARGLLLALRAGEPYRVARALTLEAMHVSTAGGRSRRQVAGLLKRSRELTAAVGRPHTLGLVPLAEGTAALMLGRWGAARESFDRAEAIFRDRCTGVAWELDTVHNLSLWAMTHMGDLAEMRRRWPVLLREAQRRGDLYAITTLSTYYTTMLRLADDDPEGARRELDAAMGRWSHRGFHVQHATAVRAHAHIDLYRGDGPAAWSRIRRHSGAYRRSLLLRVQMLRVELFELRGRAALAAALTDERPARLLRSAVRDARRLDREREPWAHALSRLLYAGVAAARGDRERAIGFLYAASDRFEAVEMALYAAAARRRLGQLLGGAQGHDLIARADQDMRALSIRDPARMTTVYAPGFPERGPRGEEFHTMSVV